MRHPSSEIRRPASRVAILFLAVGLVAATASCALLDKALPSPPKAAAAVAGPLPAPPGPSGPKPPSLPVSVDIYRTGKIDPRAKLPETAAVKAAFRDPFQDGLRLLTENLLKGESDPFLKAKLIHDWICASISYDAAMLRQGTVANQDIQSVLSSRKAVCSGYSRVFQAMADFAGIPCVTVSGYVKNQRGARGLGQDNSHAWNLVQIHGRWYIVDTTFDAGYVKEWVFVKKYSTENLFVDPARSIYARYPKEAWHQLLSSPLSGQDFLNLPDAETAFFDYGLEFDSQRIAWENPTLGLYSLELKGGKDEIVLDGALLGPDGRELPGATFLKRPGSGRYGISASMPQKGVYTLEVYAKRRGEARFDYLVESAKFEGKILPALDKADRTALAALFEKIPPSGYYRFREDPFAPETKETAMRLFTAAGFPPGSLQKVLSLKLVNQKASEIQTYPKVYARYQDSPSDSLESPLSGILRAGEEATFAYRSRESKEAALIVGDDFFPMERSAEGVFSLRMKLSKPGRISLGLSDNGIDYDIALSWQVLP